MKILRIFLWLLLLTGIIYPLIVTGIAQGVLKRKADGDLIVSKGKIIGSALIGQKFENASYFWPRPSAIDYNPLPSGGSNLGPISHVLKKTIEERKAKISKGDDSVPSELLFASGSGVDPHISVEAAYFQIKRVASARKLDPEVIKKLVDSMVIGRSLGFLGTKRVNVLLLNIALDDLVVK